ENELELIVRDADARVRDADDDVDVARNARDGDPTAGLRELHRVGEEVEDNLPHASPIAAHAHRAVAWRVFVLQLLPLDLNVRQHRSLREHLVHRELGKLELNAPGFDLGECKDVLDQAEEVSLTFLDAPKVLALCFGDRAV